MPIAHIVRSIYLHRPTIIYILSQNNNGCFCQPSIRITLIMQSYTVLLVVFAAVSTNSRLTPENVTDRAGNFAGGDSRIIWAKPPSLKNYSAKWHFDAGSNAGLYNMANHFLDVVIPVEQKHLPYDTIIGLSNGTVALTDGIKTLIGHAFGFALCISLGIVFIIVMPIVGCCFCGCRVANKCGGKRHQQNPRPGTFYCLFISLIIVSIFLFAGVIMVIVTNTSIGDTVNKMESITERNLDDIINFMDNTAMELQFVGVNGSQFVRDVIFRDLDNIEEIIVTKLKDVIFTQAHIESLIREAQEYGAAVQSVHGAMRAVADAQSGLQAKETELSTRRIPPITTPLTTLLSNPGCAIQCSTNIVPAAIRTAAPISQLPNMSSSLDATSAAANMGLGTLGRRAQQHLDGIPNRIVQDTTTIRQSVKGLLNDFVDKVETSLQRMMRLPNSVRTSVSNMKTRSTDFFKGAQSYDKFRQNVGLLLGLAIFMVLLLQVDGLIFGGKGFNYSATFKNPTRRSSTSNTGGALLLVAVFCVFLYSSLLMFVVTTTFFVGGAFEKFVCEPLMDPEYAAFERLLDNPSGGVIGGDGYFLGKILFGNGTIPLTASGALESCRKGGGAFAALKLDAIVDLAAMTDLRQVGNMRQHIAALNINLPDVQFLDAAQETILRDFANVLTSFDFTLYKRVLQQPTMFSGFRPMVEVIRSSSTDPANSATVRAELATTATNLNSMIIDFVNPLEQKQADLLQKVNQLEAATGGTPVRTTEFINAVRSTNAYLAASGDSAVRQVITNYTDRIFGIADQFATNLESSIRDDILRCRPLWDIWYSIIHDGLCMRIVQVLNGFWYGLGWCVFFMIVSLILNVRLAKYFRIMHTEDPSIPGEMDTYASYGPYGYGQPPYGDNTMQYPQQQPMASMTPGAQGMRGYTDLSAASTGAQSYMGDPGYQQTGQQPNYASHAATDDQYSRRAPAQATEDPSGYYADDPYQQTDYYGTYPYQQTDYDGTDQQQTGYEDGYQQSQGADADTEAKSAKQQPSSRLRGHHSRKHSTSADQPVEAETTDQNLEY